MVGGRLLSNSAPWATVRLPGCGRETSSLGFSQEDEPRAAGQKTRKGRTGPIAPRSPKGAGCGPWAPTPKGVEPDLFCLGFQSLCHITVGASARFRGDNHLEGLSRPAEGAGLTPAPQTEGRTTHTSGQPHFCSPLHREGGADPSSALYVTQEGRSHLEPRDPGLSALFPELGTVSPGLGQSAAK